MPRRYKLRLSDGTVLQVDEDGLNTWLVDGKAMVQAEDSSQWRLLRDFLREEREAARRPSRQRPSLGGALPLVPPPPRLDAAPSGPAVPPSEPLARPSIGDPSAVQVLADDPGAAASPSPHRQWSPNDDVAVIPFKPLDDEATVRPPVSPRREAPEPPSVASRPSVLTLADDPVPRPRLKLLDDEAPVPTGSLTATLLGLASGLGTLLSRGLEALGRLEHGLQPRGWITALTAWFGRLTRRAPEDRSRPSVAPREPTPPKASAPPLREALKPPPPISELATLRFADAKEPREADDLYDGEYGEYGESFLRIAWLWTVRIVLLAGLVAGGVFAALTWETWFPRAARLGQALFGEIDRRAHPAGPTAEEQRALQAATEQLPHLAPDTIRLVLSASPGGDLAPADVFELAGEAADRGLNALTARETEELRALQGQLVDTLRPEEQRRVHAYERARGHRVLFEFENRRVLELVARGARALPPPGRVRLQALLGKTIATGLARAPEGASPDKAGP